MTTTKKVRRSRSLKHTRVNDILLGPIERPLIAYLVKVLPKWVTPDILTFTGLAACLIILAAYALCHFDKSFLWLATFGFILNWFGDSLDGSLARYRKIERPRYGFFIDHTMDALGIVFIFLGMGLSPFAHFEIAMLPLIAYLMMEVQAVSALYSNNVFKISYGKLGPTEARAIAIVINTLLFFLKSPSIKLPYGTFLLFDVFLVFVAAVLLFIFIYSAIKVGRALAQMEKPQRSL